MSTLRSAVSITVFVGGLVISPASARADVILLGSTRSITTSVSFRDFADTDADGTPDTLILEKQIIDTFEAPTVGGPWSVTHAMSELVAGMSASTASEYSSTIGPLEFTASARSSVLASAGTMQWVNSGAGAGYAVGFEIDQPYRFSFAANVIATASPDGYLLSDAYLADYFFNGITGVTAPVEGGSSSVNSSGLLRPGIYFLIGSQSISASMGTPIFVPMPVGFAEAEFDLSLTLTPVSIPEPAAALLWVVAIGFLVRQRWLRSPRGRLATCEKRGSSA